MNPSNNGLILPLLSERLERIREQEEEIRSNLALLINLDDSLKDHLSMIEETLTLFFETSIEEYFFSKIKKNAPQSPYIVKDSRK